MTIFSKFIIAACFTCIIFSCKSNHEKHTPSPKTKSISSVTENSENHNVFKSHVPYSITRSIIEDKDGNIWFATFEGIIKFNGERFQNITSEITKDRFFSVFEDSKGFLWFGSLGSGVYKYDGQNFKNFTTDDGLLNNEIIAIYEDIDRNIWLGANGGASRYDGKRFKNFILKNNTMVVDTSGMIIPNLERPPKEVNSITQDNNGNIWLATRGLTFVHNGKSFKIASHKGREFGNVRSLITDKDGNIWLGGIDGLWFYNGRSFKKISPSFVGYVYQDSKANIWTSAQYTVTWALTRYNFESANDPWTTSNIIKDGEKMLFGILEDRNQNIWSGKLDGIFRYDGYTFEEFKN